MARVGAAAVFNFNFAILYGKVVSDSLMICEHLRRYLKGFKTELSIVDFSSSSFGMYSMERAKLAGLGDIGHAAGWIVFVAGLVLE